MLAASDGVWVSGGLPGYYYGYDFAGSTIVRAGGLVLNPPTAGLVTAAGAVLALVVFQSRWRYLLATVLTLATVATGSRGGLVVIAAGLVLPWVIDRLGSATAVVIAVFVGAGAAMEVASQGGSAYHVGGLLGGLTDAFRWPFGRGFGFAGNFADRQIAESAESLAGIAFSGMGLVAVAVFVVCGVALVRRALSGDQKRLALMSLGILVTALVAETAGSLNGTVILWLTLGYVLRAPGHRDPGELLGAPTASRRSRGSLPAASERDRRRSNHRLTGSNVGDH